MTDYSTVQHKLWEAETEILSVIHAICMENGLRYSLAYGTLLGAVRHGGFIPWDDDIDVMMPREDYERFKKICAAHMPEGFVFQNEDDYEDLVNNFAKVRKDHTVFLQRESERKTSYHKGIYVDIFPADRVAPAGMARKRQYALFAINLLFNRAHTSGAGGMTGFAEKALLKLVPRKYYRRLSIWAGRRSRRWNDRPDSEYVLPCTIRDCKRYYPADMFDRLTKLPFENGQYNVTAKYDEFLTIRYGDYMQLPPEEERVWKHHPILIDFEHNYEELAAKS